MKTNFTYRKLWLMAIFSSSSLLMSAQVTLTKTLPPIGSTYDSYVHLNAQTMSFPDTSDNAVWDYTAITTGLTFSKGGSGIVKRYADITTADKDSFPTADYVEDYEGGVDPYKTNSRIYYKDNGDVLTQLGSYLKTGNNEQYLMRSDSFFVFNTPYKGSWDTKAPFGNVAYNRRYVSYGTFKIRNEVYNNAVMFIAGPNFTGQSFLVYTMQPYFSRLAIITLLDNGTGTINYYPPTGTTGMNDKTNKSLLTIYPNPVNDALFVVSDINLNGARAEVFDLTGKEIKAEENFNNNINVSDLNNGVYLIRVKTKDSRILEQRFIKQ